MVSSWLENIDYTNLSTGIASSNNDDSIQLLSTVDAIQIIGDFNSCTLYDTSGNKIIETSDALIKTDGFSSGTYIARINNGNQIITKKISLYIP